MKDFDVGEVIGQVFKLAFANLLPFMILGGACLAPYLGFLQWQSQVMGLVGESVKPVEFLGFTVGGLLLYFLLLFLLNGAISYGVFQHLSGNKASLGECIKVGFRRLPPIIGVALASGLLVFLGYVALVVPGIILYVMLYLAVPVAVIERAGVGQALSRSRDLTAGMRWRVFGVIFVLSLVSFVIALPMNFSHLFLPLRGAVTLQWAATVFGTVLQAVGMGVVYYQLRSTKEHFNVDEIASVFA